MGGYPSIWIKPNDHTSAGADSSGRYFFVDVEMWGQEIYYIINK